MEKKFAFQPLVLSMKQQLIWVKISDWNTAEEYGSKTINNIHTELMQLVHDRRAQGFIPAYQLNKILLHFKNTQCLTSIRVEKVLFREHKSSCRAKAVHLNKKA